MPPHYVCTLCENGPLSVYLPKRVWSGFVPGREAALTQQLMGFAMQVGPPPLGRSLASMHSHPCFRRRGGEPPKHHGAGGSTRQSDRLDTRSTTLQTPTALCKGDFSWGMILGDDVGHLPLTLSPPPPPPPPHAAARAPSLYPAPITILPTLLFPSLGPLHDSSDRLGAQLPSRTRHRAPQHSVLEHPGRLGPGVPDQRVWEPRRLVRATLYRHPPDRRHNRCPTAQLKPRGGVLCRCLARCLSATMGTLPIFVVPAAARIHARDSLRRRANELDALAEGGCAWVSGCG